MFEQDEENKRNESQIDANIVWSARVEWIQNVRRATADLLTAINNYIYSDENDVDLNNAHYIYCNSHIHFPIYGMTYIVNPNHYMFSLS